MKLLFLIFHGFNPANGISKKIHYQINALKSLGIDTKLCYLEERNKNKLRKIDNTVLRNYGCGITGKILKRIEYNSIIKYVISHDINIIYMRSNHNANPFTLWMVYRLRKAGVKIIMEIPTYPYDQEYLGFNRQKKLLIDKCFRHLLAKQLFRIVTFSDYDTIFGIPTIRISNGIDFEQIKMKQSICTINNEIHLIGVAEIHYWHGFDRLIKGFINYYKTSPINKVYFHIVGDFFSERERNEIIPLIQQNHLEDYVILHGSKHGLELDKLFEKANIAIGSLARHRSGITYIKTLKNREYAARGIAFIYSEIDSDFEDKPYILKICPDETAIDIYQIINFHNHQKLSPQNIRDSVRFLSWKEQMNKVLKVTLTHK